MAAVDRLNLVPPSTINNFPNPRTSTKRQDRANIANQLVYAPNPLLIVKTDTNWNPTFDPSA